jgi:hypothetical protein
MPVLHPAVQGENGTSEWSEWGEDENVDQLLFLATQVRK